VGVGGGALPGQLNADDPPWGFVSNADVAEDLLIQPQRREGELVPQIIQKGPVVFPPTFAAPEDADAVVRRICVMTDTSAITTVESGVSIPGLVALVPPVLSREVRASSGLPATPPLEPAGPTDPADPADLTGPADPTGTEMGVVVEWRAVGVARFSLASMWATAGANIGQRARLDITGPRRQHFHFASHFASFHSLVTLFQKS
jgi:hypothetical protein